MGDQKFIKSSKSSLEEVVTKEAPNIGLNYQLEIICYADKKKYITQEQKEDMYKLAFYRHRVDKKYSPTIGEDAKRVVRRIFDWYPNCLPKLKSFLEAN